MELLFALAFVGWAWLRGFSPDLMTSGGEKFMEIAFIKAILRSDTFPPLDPWLSGFGISYYYFGYVMTSLLARFSGVPATSAFTLGIAHLFALTATGAFGVAYNLVSAARRDEKGPAIGYGLLGATFVALMGNLEGLLEAVRSKGLGSEAFWKWIDVPGLWEKAQVTGDWFPGTGWWWWRGSRVIRDLDLLGRPIPIQPIDEFPFFSFILGDMHPHVLALPFVLLVVALAFNLFRGRGRPSWAEIGLLGLALGGLAFLNTWDFPIYLGLTLLVYGARRYREFGAATTDFWKDLSLVAGSVLGLGVLLYLPFYIGFSSQAGGILPNLLFPTRLHQYLIMFGPFIFVLVCWLGLLLARAFESRKDNLPLRTGLTWLAVLLLFPLGMLACCFRKKPSSLVVTWHSDVVRQWAVRPFLTPLEHWLLRSAEAVVTTSPPLLEQSRVLPTYEKKCHVIPLGIDPEPFISLPASTQRLADGLRASFPHPLIVFVGRLVRYKGLDVLVRALRNVNAWALVVGSGPMRRALERLARREGMEKRIKFVGGVSDHDLPAYLHAADLFVLPSVSRNEAFGICQLEAMAAGLPVISTDLPLRERAMVFVSRSLA